MVNLIHLKKIRGDKIFIYIETFQINLSYYNSNSSNAGGVAGKTYNNSSSNSNALGRTTNSAPVPSQINSQLYQQQPQGVNRPLSSTGNNMQQNVGVKGPIIMRNLDKPTGIGSQVRIMNNSVCL